MKTSNLKVRKKQIQYAEEKSSKLHDITFPKTLINAALSTETLNAVVDWADLIEKQGKKKVGKKRTVKSTKKQTGKPKNVRKVVADNSDVVCCV